jgi:hypothetical protein
MDNNIATALISGGGSVLVAITALILNYRGFASLDARLTSLDSRVDGRFGLLEARMDKFETRVDSRFNSMQADMKDLNKTMMALEIDVALLKDKVGM